ncbi:MAG TPA: hypothetical protein VJ757_10225 [Pseudonocardiaceae bacterium]|nr:hypothetical protein [Pseudonocardiaceae bacterium]
MSVPSDELFQLPFPRPDVLDIAPLYRTLQAGAPTTPYRRADRGLTALPIAW